ncbi:MAG: molybdopterin converting factor subunit 1 [Rhodospirillales bacterium]
MSAARGGMKILYFASIRERAGLAEEEVTPPPDVRDVRGLIAWLRHRGGGPAAALADLALVRVAVDQEHARLDASLAGAVEVAFFPPVTGGRR